MYYFPLTLKKKEKVEFLNVTEQGRFNTTPESLFLKKKSYLKDEYMEERQL